jgi:23S rRNA pseudouridine2457 synthase
MSRVILLNKPFGVICQFSEDGLHPTLKSCLPISGVYPAGRLDADSEGLVVLTDDGVLQQLIAKPRFKKEKSYWVQVEKIPSEAALDGLCEGVQLGKTVTLPAHARIIPEPKGLWPCDPPIRYRQAIPTAWLELRICEGKNRQIRRMTAKIGYPTLRLIRYTIGPWCLQGLAPGEWKEVNSVDGQEL